jgi:hypothetical protein
LEGAKAFVWNIISSTGFYNFLLIINLCKRCNKNNSSTDAIYENNSSTDAICENNSRITWTDHKTNTETAKELNITPVLGKIEGYKRKWIQHVS